MELTEKDFKTVLFVFEAQNGFPVSSEKEELISDAGLNNPDMDALTDYLVNLLDMKMPEDVEQRISAYWALSKRADIALIPKFQNWLKQELSSGSSDTIFQIMIALDNFDEPVFSPDREGGYAAIDTDLNLRDARNYLDSL